jgi:hypothetical protein
LPRRQVAFYEDEVDIHLNPKIGLDWMVRGLQKNSTFPAWLPPVLTSLTSLVQAYQ